MKVVISSFLILYCALSFSQTGNAVGFYEQGVKESNNKNNRSADSLFSLSADLEPHPDTYFNRATVRARLNNVKGYCEDMACSAAMGDVEALNLFCKNCGKADTVRNKVQPIKFWQTSYTIKYKCIYFDNSLVGRYNSHNSLLGFGWSNSEIFDSVKDSLLFKTGNMPRFAGGDIQLARFVQSNLQYPADAREGGASGKVSLRFVVNAFGYIENVEVMKGVSGYPSCDYEAVRVITIMPRWEPARVNGKNVNSYYYLPLTFKIQ